MPRLTPAHWREVAKALERLGAAYKRTRGDHEIYRKPGIRALVFPRVKDVPVHIQKSLMRDLGVDSDAWLAALAGEDAPETPEAEH